MRIETKLVANNGLRQECVSLDLPDEDWALLAQFRQNADVLRSTRFVREQRGGSIGLKWTRGGGVQVGGKHIDEEPVWAMLLKLRPFVLQNERCYLPSVLKMLKRHLRHSAFHRHLDELRDGFLLKRMNARIRLWGPGRSPLSQEVVMDWLNSYHYHHDEKKVEAVRRDLGPFANEQDGMGIAIFALVDMVQAVLDTGAFAETLQLCSEGAIAEIFCPVEYFGEG